MALVAKSYKGLKQVGEVYVANGRTYIKVELANGNLKQVRAYSEKEYLKYYPGEKIEEEVATLSQKNALGFTEGFITIFKGDTYPHKDWFKANGAKYTKWWGWGFASTAEIPEDLPEDVEAIRLDWDKVGAEDETLKPEVQLKKIIDSLMYEEDESEFYGSIGERVQIKVVVEKALHLNGYYGPSTMHVLRAENGNVFVWTTASKSWEEGSEKTIRGTIKAHKTFRNCNQTILTRCVEVKEK